jgi:hypothetical protein
MTDKWSLDKYLQLRTPIFEMLSGQNQKLMLKVNGFISALMTT